MRLRHGTGFAVQTAPVPASAEPRFGVEFNGRLDVDSPILELEVWDESCDTHGFARAVLRLDAFEEDLEADRWLPLCLWDPLAGVWHEPAMERLLHVRLRVTEYPRPSGHIARARLEEAEVAARRQWQREALQEAHWLLLYGRYQRQLVQWRTFRRVCRAAQAQMLQDEDVQRMDTAQVLLFAERGI